MNIERVLEELNKSSIIKKESKCDTCKNFSINVNGTVYHWMCSKSHLQNVNGLINSKPLIEVCNDYISK